MRQLFSSPRIENVEAVARLLEEAGIEVRITNGRSYRGAIRGNFSYRDHGSGAPRPAVWVIRSDQQPEARRLLREAGLLQAAPRSEGFLPPPASVASGDRGLLAARGGGRFRYGMLVAVAVAAALAMLAWRAGHRDPAGPGTDVAAPTAGAQATRTVPPGGMPVIATLPEEGFVVATPPALAETLLQQAMADAGVDRACLSIDGRDPDAALVAALVARGLDVAPASDCDGAALPVAVGEYTTDGSGRGTVRVKLGDAADEVLRVRREGRDWLPDGPE